MTQRFAAEDGQVIDVEAAAAQLRDHAEQVNELTVVSEESLAGGGVHFVFEGLATAEPDAGHRASNNRSAAEKLGLVIQGETIQVLEFPGQRAATWP